MEIFYAPLSGPVIPLEDVPDPVFAQRMAGDGLAIDPIDHQVLSPCSGKVTQVHLLVVRSIGLAQCLAATDRIATPAGYVPVTQVRPGMIVWTLDASGQRVAAPVLLVTHIPAPIHHYILRVTLFDGRLVEASPGHPMLIGRRLGDLTVGDDLDGSRVTSIEQIPYSGATWDLLPAGSTGAYWANDVLLGSTLRPSWLAAPAIRVERSGRAAE